ncbi:Ig-like domain-containing protein [Candidatus Poribacteria bacterium]|nr:Ig-like domain-containing protein [Candidatus Poribacteria bacterium]
MRFSINKKILLTLFLLGFIAGCRNPFSPEETEVKGSVVDSNGDAVSGAAISISPGKATATTDSNGDYILKDIRPGSYTIKAKKTGYSDNTGTVTVDSSAGFSCYDPKDIDAPEIKLSGSTSSTDTSRPYITSLNPPRNTEATADMNITAIFNEAMNSASITSTSFILSYYDSSQSKSISVDGDISYNSIDKKAIFDPKSSLPIGYTFTATIKTGMEDTAGNNLANDTTWTFWTPKAGGNLTVKYTFSETGQKATDKFKLTAGIAKFIMTHNGSSTFSVSLIGNGKNESLISQTGAADKVSKAIYIAATSEDYILNITADGTWTVSVEQ